MSQITCKRHVFMTKIRPGKMDAYVSMHDRIYPEVCEGLRASGVSSLEIFREKDTLVMVHISLSLSLSLLNNRLPNADYRDGRRYRFGKGDGSEIKVQRGSQM